MVYLCISMNKELAHINPAVRRKAIFSIKPENSFEILRKVILNDPSPVIRHEVAFILSKLKEKRAVDLLVKIVETDPSDLVRHEAIESLGDLEIINEKVTNLLKSLLHDKNPFIRDTAEVALNTLSLINNSGKFRT